jgi:hypothetical protein
MLIVSMHVAFFFFMIDPGRAFVVCHGLYKRRQPRDLFLDGWGIVERTLASSRSISIFYDRALAVAHRVHKGVRNEFLLAMNLLSSEKLR